MRYIAAVTNVSGQREVERYDSSIWQVLELKSIRGFNSTFVSHHAF